MKNRKVASIVGALVVTAGMIAYFLSNDSEHAHHAEIPDLEGRDKFSCYMMAHSAQCRLYYLKKNDTAALESVKESCLTIPKSKFSKSRCPKDLYLATCQGIVRDYHHPDRVLYDKVFYDKGQHWTMELVQSICDKLKGKLITGD